VIVIASILFSHWVTLGYLKVREMINPSSQSLVYLANTLNDNLAFTRFFDVLWMPLTFSAVLGSLLVLIFGVLYSHRIAGPIFNLKRMMSQVAEGNLDVMMRIRNKDEFHDVQDAFNRMVTGLKTHLEDLEEAVRKLPEPSRKEFEALLVELRKPR